MAEEQNENDKKTVEPPANWKDARAVRAWLKHIIAQRAHLSEMLETSQFMLESSVHRDRKALPPSPDPEEEPEEPPHKRLVEYLKGPPAEGEGPPPHEMGEIERRHLDLLTAGIVSEPIWSDLVSVRSWLNTSAYLMDNQAAQLEGLASMLRSVAQELRQARPPWPTEPADEPPAPTKDPA